MSETNGATWSLSPKPARGGRTRVALLHGKEELASDVVDLQRKAQRAKLAGVLHAAMPAIDASEFEQQLQALATSDAQQRERKRTAGRSEDEELLTTDSGNARRLVELHGEDIRFVVGIGWHVWDGTRWGRDDRRRIDLLARDVARAFIRQSATLAGDPRAIRFARHGIKSAGRGKIESAVALARSEPGISVLAAEMDADPMLLNVENGTIDLTTGEMRSHCRADLLSKLAPAKFDPDATCPTFDRFLAEIQPDERNRAFLLRLLGYALTGRISEHVLPVCWGGGANGKSTLLGAVVELMGDYAAPLPPEVLMSSASDRHPTELAKLHGLRLAVAHESDQGRRLAEGKVKQLTGGDRISARRMREDFYEFDPTHKVALVTNHRPEIRGTDDGIWRRVLLIPFSVQIPKAEQDSTLPEQLRAERSGILNRLLAGCREWQRWGLQPPDSVTGATTEYRTEQDPLGDWISERCSEVATARAKASDLWASYLEHCRGEHHLSRAAWADGLRARGFRQERDKAARWWVGIGLQAPTDDRSEVTR